MVHFLCSQHITLATTTQRLTMNSSGRVVGNTNDNAKFHVTSEISKPGTNGDLAIVTDNNAFIIKGTNRRFKLFDISGFILLKSLGKQVQTYSRNKCHFVRYNKVALTLLLIIKRLRCY